MAQHVKCSDLQARLAGSALSGYFVGDTGWDWGGVTWRDGLPFSNVGKGGVTGTVTPFIT